MAFNPCRVSRGFLKGNKQRAIFILVLVQLMFIYLLTRVYLTSSGKEQAKNGCLRKPCSTCTEQPKTHTEQPKTDTKQSKTNIPGNTHLPLLMEKSAYKVNITKNPIYQRFNITPRVRKPNVTLLLIVSSAPKRFNRRDTIRKTWWNLCKDTTTIKKYKVTIKCIFMTDKQKENSKIYDRISEEQDTFKDLEFQSLTGGVEFGIRYMYHLAWAASNYNFDYFLRMDDDYFICLDRVINELPMPPVGNFHWGWVHCIKNITRPEESTIMFSYDVIARFLSQDPNKLFCHPWADQLIAVWVEQLNLPILYHTDPRLHHHPPAESLKEFQNPKDICVRYIGVHGSYPKTMNNLWNNRGDYSLNANNKTLVSNSKRCYLNSKFNWRIFQSSWQYEPKLCINNPTWDTTKQGNGTIYQGRQFDELGVRV